MVGYTWEDEGQRTLSGSRNNFPSDDVPFLGAGGADGQTNGGGGYDWAIQSVFGRLTYNYDQRYLFETTMRYDGSSRFPTDSKYGFSLLWLQVGVSLKNSFGRKMKICLSLII